MILVAQPSRLFTIATAVAFFIHPSIASQADKKQGAGVLPGGAQPLHVEDGTDFASMMIDRLDRFLLRQLDESQVARNHRVLSNATPESYANWKTESRVELQRIVGLVDQRQTVNELTLDQTTGRSAVLGETEKTTILSVSWPTVGDLRACGLLLKPKTDIRGFVVAIPDSDQTPLSLVGLAEDKHTGSYAIRLADAGFCVVIPTLLDRTLEARLGSKTVLTHREFIYRSAFELGRHLIGYEVAAVLGAVDFCEHQKSKTDADAKTGLIGWGEGGMLATYTAAIDDRVDTVLISGHFEQRKAIWNQPLDRNVFGLLNQFGDAELVAMFHGNVFIEAARGVELTLPGEGGAPAELATPSLDSVKSEFDRTAKLRRQFGLSEPVLIERDNGTGHPLQDETLATFCRMLDSTSGDLASSPVIRGTHSPPETDAIQRRLIHQYDQHNQRVLNDSEYVRAEFMKDLKTDSMEAFEKSVEPYREYFATKVIGRYEMPLSEFNAKARVAYERETWTGYEVTLDVFPDVFAYGILLLPRDIKPDERRPVVVCQHGLEGRPQDIIEGDHRAYHDYAAKLAERGFIVFAPQNPYIFKDRFRTLQRKSNPLGKTLFSVIVPQHQQIVNWIKTLPQVDSKRIGFYGLSYGGKTAMRVPALVDDYCLSICSADFNDWVWKNASTRGKYTYVRTYEYEIFEFDLGSTFNYAEMAALICPKPFMVERGHFDMVAPDERVALEFAKVRNLYAAKLGIGDQSEIEWFVGPHTINGKASFDFLHRHLDWNKPDGE